MGLIRLGATSPTKDGKGMGFHDRELMGNLSMAVRVVKGQASEKAKPWKVRKWINQN